MSIETTPTYSVEQAIAWNEEAKRNAPSNAIYLPASAEEDARRFYAAEAAAGRFGRSFWD